jgi:hypothetical protein
LQDFRTSIDLGLKESLSQERRGVGPDGQQGLRLKATLSLQFPSLVILTLTLWSLGCNAPCTTNLADGQFAKNSMPCEISSSHGGEYDVQNCLLGYTAV